MEQLSKISSSSPYAVRDSDICYAVYLPVISDLLPTTILISVEVARNHKFTQLLRSIPRLVMCPRQKYVTRSYKGRGSCINPIKRTSIAPERNTKLQQFQVIRLSEWHHCHNELPKNGG